MSLTELLIIHCAPTLMGKKCSSLVCLKNLDSPYEEELAGLRMKGLSFFFLTNRKGCPLLFLYRREKLEKIIRKAKARKMLRQDGYDTSSLEGCLRRLGKRMQEEEEFPHEIGIFLGYPVEDVKGFIENDGENFILSGPWKVYHNRKKAERTFRIYSDCTKCLLRIHEEGSAIDRLCI